MNPARCGVLCALLLGCGVSAEAGSEALAQRQAIEQGEVFDNPAVVALVPRRQRCDVSSNDAVCSGVLLAERMVLTAAHCLRGLPRGELEVRFPATSEGAPAAYRGIAASKVHPAYQREFDDNDLGLIWLSEPAPTVPVSLLDGSLDESWVGEQARVVGFGEVLGGGGARGVQRAGTVTITEIQAATLRYAPSPAMTCRGDSGGPVFVRVGGVDTLVAITTSGDAACEELGVAARIDQERADLLARGLSSSTRAPGVAEAALCSMECEDALDCPADLVCSSDSSGRQRCQLRDFVPLSLDEVCQRDDDCGDGVCVPLGAACRCSRPCSGSAEAPSRDGPSGGCSSSGRKGAGLAPLFAWLLLVRVRLQRAHKRRLCQRVPGNRTRYLAANRRDR